ncbi:MAG TPA: tRNA lysidine(34) synthetase TilS, partial [Dehalococcoidia bacterium]|nr:tRNA lysidine(34) synthetase TilS [Dehalococcoidia bacterium]
PLLCLSREETARYCQELGIEARQDPTNLLPDATRNRLRNQLLPELRHYNPRIDEALVRLANAAAADDAVLESLASEALQELAAIDNESVSILRERFAALAPALQVRLLRLAAERLLQPAPQLEAVHLEAAQDALRSPRGSVSLPGGLQLDVTPERLLLRLDEAPVAQPLPETPLAVPGITIVGDWRLEAEAAPLPVDPAQADPLLALLDADVLGPHPYVRSRRPGDRLQPLGMQGEKKLQDLLVDAHVPASERDALPLVCGERGIAWVVGVRIAQPAAIGPRTQRAVRLRASRVDSTRERD